MHHTGADADFPVVKDTKTRVKEYVNQNMKDMHKLETKTKETHVKKEEYWTSQWTQRWDLPWNTWISEEAAKNITDYGEPTSTLAAMRATGAKVRKWKPIANDAPNYQVNGYERGGAAMEKATAIAEKAMVTSQKAEVVAMDTLKMVTEDRRVAEAARAQMPNMSPREHTVSTWVQEAEAIHERKRNQHSVPRGY